MALIKPLNVLALVKGDERYIFLYADGQRRELALTLSRFARDPKLSFTWADAAVLMVRCGHPPKLK